MPVLQLFFLECTSLCLYMVDRLCLYLWSCLPPCILYNYQYTPVERKHIKMILYKLWLSLLTSSMYCLHIQIMYINGVHLIGLHYMLSVLLIIGKWELYILYMVKGRGIGNSLGDFGQEMHNLGSCMWLGGWTCERYCYYCEWGKQRMNNFFDII